MVTEMMKFTGDQENLKGEVLIYGRCRRDEKLIGVYASTDAVDFAMRLKIPLGELERRVENEDSVEHCLYFSSSASEGSEPKILLCCYFVKVEITGETLPENFNGADIVYLGNLWFETTMDRTLFSLVKQYADRFVDQSIGRYGLPFAKRNIFGIDETEKKYDDFEDVSERTIYMTAQLFSPLIYAVDQSQGTEIKRIRNMLYRFFQGSQISFFNDVSEVIRILSDTSINKKLLNRYLEKIGAIMSENFELAGTKKVEISAMVDKETVTSNMETS